MWPRGSCLWQSLELRIHIKSARTHASVKAQSESQLSPIAPPTKMHFTSATYFSLAALLSTAAAFSCPSYIRDYGFAPVCCLNINGQVGTGCQFTLSTVPYQTLTAEQAQPITAECMKKAGQ